MGYSHYWTPCGPMEEQEFERVFHDFRKLYFSETRRIKEIIRGPLGRGEPIISENQISFNGDRHCGHERNRDVLFYVPGREKKVSPSTVYGTHVESSPVRTCSAGRCSCESVTMFSNANNGLTELWESDREFFSGQIKTNYKPYDLAVQCLLIIADRYSEGFEVSSDGADEYWFDAKLLCQINLGYGLNFHLCSVT